MTKPYVAPTLDVPVLSILGPLDQFIAGPELTGDQFCVLRVSMPAGVFVPLHSHPEAECFFLLSGALKVYSTQETSIPHFPIPPTTIKFPLKFASQIDV